MIIMAMQHATFHNEHVTVMCNIINSISSSDK
jgi:hypothetical protein